MSPTDRFLLLCLLPQDILAILCLKGPSTEGIFRKAASEKARKELKEELNCGGVVNLKQLPVHLLAVVFKVSLLQSSQTLFGGGGRHQQTHQETSTLRAKSADVRV